MAGVEEHMRELSRIMLTRVEALGEQLADRIYSRIDGYRATPSARGPRARVWRGSRSRC